MGRILDRSVRKTVAALRPRGTRSSCAAVKLDLTASMARRVLTGYAASRRGDRLEALSWSYRLRRQFEATEKRSDDCATRRDWRAVVHWMIVLQDAVVPTPWPAPSLGVAYWKRRGFRIDATEVTTDSVVMDDFSHAWDHGTLPGEHAEIQIWSEPRPHDFIREIYLRCLENCDSSYVRVAGKPGMRAESRSSDGDEVRRIAVWIADGNRLRGFGLTDHEHDAMAPRHLAAFDALLQGIELE